MYTEKYPFEICATSSYIIEFADLKAEEEEEERTKKKTPPHR